MNKRPIHNLILFHKNLRKKRALYKIFKLEAFLLSKPFVESEVEAKVETDVELMLDVIKHAS